MRRLTDADRVRQLMQMLGGEANQEGRAAFCHYDFYAYPAIHPPSFRRAVEEVLGR